MLRMIFVIGIIIAGALYSLIGPFQGLLFYLWNAYFRPDYWTYGPFIMSLRLSLVIGIYVIIRTILAMPKAQISAGTILIWLFFVQAFIGTVTSEWSWDSWNALDVFGRVIVMTYLIVVLVTDRSRFRLVLLVICLSLGFDMAKQGWADLVRAPGRVNSNPIAFLGDNNGVALGLFMLVPLMGALAQTSTKFWEKRLHQFFAIGVTLRAISTYSRGGFLGGAALLVIMVIRAEKKVRAALSIAVVAATVLSFMPQDFWDRMSTIRVEEGEERDESSAGRLHFWGVAIDMANAKPWTGVGLAAFSASYVNYNTDERWQGQRAAHSTWFGVLGDLGYPGLVLFVANLFMAYWACWRVHRVARKRTELRELRIYANALISALVVFTVSGSFLSSQYNEMAWHIFGLSAALRLIAEDEVKALGTTPKVSSQAA